MVEQLERIVHEIYSLKQIYPMAVIYYDAETNEVRISYPVPNEIYINQEPMSKEDWKNIPPNTL